MIEKRVTLILHNADRTLWTGGQVRVIVTDLFDDLNQLRSQNVSAPIVDLRLQLPFDAGQLYGITVSARKHRTAFTLVRRQDFIVAPDEIETDRIVVRLMLVPGKPVSSDLAAGHERLQAAGSPFAASVTGVTSSRFLSLEPAAQMALLNIETKLRATLVDGLSLLSFVAGVREVAVDRLFLFMRAGAKEAVARSPFFADAPGHAAPKHPAGLPDHPDSFKHTRFGEGNVQLSFSATAEPVAAGGATTVLCHSVDVDIDLARGLRHVIEFLDNNVFMPGKKTDQTLVYALLFNQNIEPLYTLDPLEAASGRKAARPRSPASSRRQPARSRSQRRVRSGRRRRPSA